MIWEKSADKTRSCGLFLDSGRFRIGFFPCGTNARAAVRLGLPDAINNVFHLGSRFDEIRSTVKITSSHCKIERRASLRVNYVQDDSSGDKFLQALEAAFSCSVMQRRQTRGALMIEIHFVFLKNPLELLDVVVSNCCKEKHFWRERNTSCSLDRSIPATVERGDSICGFLVCTHFCQFFAVG